MQYDTFMWFPDEDGKLGNARPVGESSDAWFEPVGAFEIDSFQFKVALSGAPNVSQEGSAPKRGVKFEQLQVVKPVELASTLLFRACTERTKIPTAILVSRLSGGEPLMYLQYVFREVRVDKVSWQQDDEGKRTKETVLLRFSEMALQYIPQKATGAYGQPKCWTWNAGGNRAPLDAVKTYNYFVRRHETPQSWAKRQGE